MEVAKHLVNSGANVNAEGSGRETPLHIAAKGGFVEVVNHLVSVGADVNAKDNDGKNPVDYARDKSIKQILYIPPNSNLHEAVRKRHIKHSILTLISG